MRGSTFVNPFEFGKRNPPKIYRLQAWHSALERRELGRNDDQWLNLIKFSH